MYHYYIKNIKLNRVPTSLVLLSLFHLLVITLSNFLVQKPVSILGFTTTWGSFVFPFTFLATDLTVRVCGAQLARKIILIVMIPSIIVSYCISSLFVQGEWQGLSALKVVNIFIIRIVCASFIAYIMGQILDVYIFNRLRHHSFWWIAPAISTIFGSICDTIVFFLLLFIKATIN